MIKIGIIYEEKLNYPKFPFNPDQLYPEFNYLYTPDPKNRLYNEMRNLLNKMGYDSENFNTKFWNPFGSFINTGDQILIKPNFVYDNKETPFSVITHPSIIRFLIDYAYKSTGNNGKIIIGDAPQMNTDIESIKRITRIKDLITFLNEKSIPVEFVDFRYEIVENKNKIWSNRKILKNSKKNSKIIDLKQNSLLFKLETNKRRNFYGADYNRKIVNYNHCIKRNNYNISKFLLDADVVISVPKLKTHMKAGVSLNLKNMVGINVHKNYLPHYRIGCSKQDGDSFPDMNSFLNRFRILLYIFRDLFLTNYHSIYARFFYKLLGLRKYVEYFIIKLLFPQYLSYYFKMIDGNWIGNDTVWRMILDLNIILKYVNKEGKLTNKTQRKFFSIVDGIIAGEREGPLTPTPKKVGVMLMGESFLLIDLISTKIMGFDYKKIPTLKNALLLNKYPLINKSEFEHIKIISNLEKINNSNFDNLSLNLGFHPAIGWSSIKK